jgi:hypothetical protein
MANERRSMGRLAGPFEGSWDGASGKRACRITDLSAGGCFIDAYASQPIGSRLNVSLTLQDQSFRLPAEVVYVDRVQGFAVKFLDVDAATQQRLSDALAALPR